MMRKSAAEIFLACAVCLSALLVARPGQAADPPYVIVLRSRDGAVTPERSRDAQTGGGFIQVTQVEPNVIMVLMRGAVAAGAGHKGETASMQFNLHQDFEIVPTKANLRPPRLVLAAWAIGSLQSTLKEGGTADHGPACAAVVCGPNPVLNLCIKPHSVGCSENLLVNDRVGPLEAVVEPGGFCLQQTFAINAAQPKTHCHPGSAAANFDPDPKLDTQWNEVMKPFRAVPHKDFGFRVILRVVEDGPLPGVLVAPPPVESLPPPKPEKKEPALEPNAGR
ncbi:MAG TPA: hypothetical protein VH643_01470 [Gemmataceae bacterium]|jgi:hypothetical protein